MHAPDTNALADRTRAIDLPINSDVDLVQNQWWNCTPRIIDSGIPNFQARQALLLNGKGTINKLCK